MLMESTSDIEKILQCEYELKSESKNLNVFMESEYVSPQVEYCVRKKKSYLIIQQSSQ